jgi:uncharacterized protein
MPISECHIATPLASKYLQQLCKHWSHKFSVTFTPQTGRVPFAPDRDCTFEATPETLTMRIKASDPDALARMESVVVDHLKRFSFREDLGDIRWTRK